MTVKELLLQANWDVIRDFTIKTIDGDPDYNIIEMLKCFRKIIDLEPYRIGNIDYLTIRECDGGMVCNYHEIKTGYHCSLGNDWRNGLTAYNKDEAAALILWDMTWNGYEDTGDYEEENNENNNPENK